VRLAGGQALQRALATFLAVGAPSRSAALMAFLMCG